MFSIFKQFVLKFPEFQIIDSGKIFIFSKFFGNENFSGKISNFIFNNLWNFSKEKITDKNKLITKFLTFNFSSVFSGIVIPSLVIALRTALFGDKLFLYQVIAIFGLTIPLNWIIYNKVIWKNKK